MTKRRSHFGLLLRTELDRQSLSLRQLAHRIDPEKPENARRNLHRWISGEVVPDPGSRDEVADALGVDRALFTESAERTAQRERLADVLDHLADTLLELVAEKIAQQRVQGEEVPADTKVIA